MNYMTGQHRTTEFLSVVPASIRSEVPTSIRSEVAALQSTSPSTGTFPSLNQITRLDSSVALVVDSKSKEQKTGHGCSRPRTRRSSKLRCDERTRKRRSERRRRFLLHRVVPGLPSHEVDVLLAVVAHVAAGHTSTGICHGRKFCRIYIYLYVGSIPIR